MIRVADLESVADASNQRRNLWVVALLAAFIGGFSGTTIAMALLWLFIQCPA
jgi:hypothetical protein